MAAAALHEAAQEFLDACEAILATTVGGPVARAFLSPGLPVFDSACDSVSVFAQGITDEQTSPLAPIPQVGQRRRLAWQNLATLSAQAVRCISVGGNTTGGYRAPKAEVMTADAQKVMEDGWALWNGISTAIRDEALFGGTCNDIKLLSMTPMLPSGQIAGWTLTVQFQLAGYR